MNKIFRNTVFISISEIATKGLLTLTTIILVRALNPEGYGIYTFAQSLTMLFVVLLHTGFFTIGVREVAKFPERTKHLASNITLLKIFGAILSFFILLVILLIIDKPLEIKLAYSIIGIYIFAVILNLDWVFRGHDKMEVPAIASILQGLLMLVLTFLFVLNSSDYPKAIFIYSTSYLISFLFLTIAYCKQFGKIEFKFDKDTAKVLLKSSLPISLAWFVVVIYGNISIFMINIVLDNFQTGIYGAMNKVMLLLLLPNSILQAAFFPEVSRSTIQGNFDKVQRSYHRIAFLVGSYLIFAVLAFAEEIIRLLFGVEYLVGTPILRVSMVWAILSYFSATLTNSLMAWNRQADFFKATIIGGIVAIVSSYLFVKNFGAIGGMFAGILTEAFVFVSVFIFYKRLNQKTNYSEAIKSITLGMLIFSLIMAIKSYIPIFWGVILYFVSFPTLAFITKLVKLSDIHSLFRKNI